MSGISRHGSNCPSELRQSASCRICAWSRDATPQGHQGACQAASSEFMSGQAAVLPKHERTMRYSHHMLHCVSSSLSCHGRQTLWNHHWRGDARLLINPLQRTAQVVGLAPASVAEPDEAAIALTHRRFYRATSPGPTAPRTCASDDHIRPLRPPNNIGACFIAPGQVTRASTTTAGLLPQLAGYTPPMRCNPWWGH